MSTVDDLVARVTDPVLRQQLADQVATLVNHKQFGLVFQDHLPEAIEVPGLRPRTGDRVRLRGNTDGQNYLATRATKGVADIVPVTVSGETVDGAASESREYSELVVVKDFGEPVYAGLKPLASIERGGDKPKHVVIQGENYYALESLLYTHEGKVDVIMTDPPYNTGSSSWIYNDKFVDSGDDYRHSKWLAFMKRRLEHAERLLKETGVIVIAIDDTEQARLKLLCDDIFGEQNFIANIVWQGGRKNDSRFVSVGHDYMLIYGKNVDALREADTRWRERKPGIDEALAAAERIWSDADGEHLSATAEWRKWMKDFKKSGFASDSVTRFTSLDQEGRPMRTDGSTISPNPRPNLTYPLTHPITGETIAPPKNGWRYSRDEMDRRIEAGLIVFGDNASKVPSHKTFLDEMSSHVAESVFVQDRNRSSALLSDILGSRDFPYPKDVDVIARWVNIVSGNNPEAVVLDFFAGTGTTAEAVMRLNAQDGGRRQSIIITNNELSAKTAGALRKAGHLPGDPEWEAEGVFHKVTWPRIETVVTGTRRDGSTYSEGLDENVEFFELTYEDPNLIALGRRFKAIAPLLWVKAGATGPLVDDIDKEQGWALPDGGTYGVLFDIARARDFAAAVHAAGSTVRHAFIVTDSESAYQAVAASLPPESQRFSSTRLYSDFLESFRVNGKD